MLTKPTTNLSDLRKLFKNKRLRQMWRRKLDRWIRLNFRLQSKHPDGVPQYKAIDRRKFIDGYLKDAKGTI